MKLRTISILVFTAVFVPLALVGGAKVVWQSGFDQGADVSQCLIATFQNAKDDPVKLDMTEPACQRAKTYERNPLWILRRRNGE